MNDFDISFEAKSAEISASNYNKVTVSISGADGGEILDCFKPEQIIEHVGLEKLLEDTSPADILNTFEQGQFIDELDPDKIAAKIPASTVVAAFTTQDLITHMDEKEVLNCFDIETIKQHFDL